MSQYLNQFVNPSLSGGSKPSQSLEHYRIEIRKLQQKLKQTANDYEKRIHELENEIKHHRKPIFQNSPTAKPTADLNFEIYQRDNTIKELKNENTKLRQVINNPDHILIKKQNNFEVVTERDNEISRLKKALLEIESKYDGQFFNEHKVKKDYEMLLKENQSLKLHIRNLETQRKGLGEADSNEALDSINYRKQLEAANRENEVLKKVILDQEQAYRANNRVSQKPVDPNSSKRVAAFAFNTQLDDMKLEVEEYKAKNKELTKKVTDLTKQNQKFLEEREKGKRLPSRESRNVESGRLSRIREGPQQQDEIIKSYKNREVIRASFVEEPPKSEQTPKKSGRYSELGIDESIANRLSKAQDPI